MSDDEIKKKAEEALSALHPARAKAFNEQTIEELLKLKWWREMIEKLPTRREPEPVMPLQVQTQLAPVVRLRTDAYAMPTYQEIERWDRVNMAERMRRAPRLVVTPPAKYGTVWLSRNTKWGDA